MAKINEFEISMVCYNEDNKYTLEEINDMLVEWAESKDIYLGGSVKPCAPEETSDESAALPLHGVSQQRELLLAFAKWEYESAEFDDTNEYLVDKFLEEKANNCG
jgi:hypothetical protein